jgi:Spy/CpxP family protein refolding chaperone
MRKKLALLALTVALAIPGASMASPNKECPGGPPGHCKSGNGNHSQQQQQQQQQQQEQRQCIIVIGILQPANC